MANETRVRQNFVSGTITDNPLTNSATTLNSTGLAGLQAIDSTQHCALVLDPTGAGLGPEIVWVTAHTGSATSATILRGREGTTGVQHTSVITWVHVATAADFTQSGVTASRPTGTGLPYRHQRYYDTTVGSEIVYSGTAWEPVASRCSQSRVLITADRSVASTTPVTIPGNPAVVTITKVGTASKLLVQMGASRVVASGAIASLSLYAHIGSTDYTALDYTPLSNSISSSVFGSVLVPSIAAGSVTVTFYASTDGTIVVALDGTIELTVTEIPA